MPFCNRISQYCHYHVLPHFLVSPSFHESSSLVTATVTSDSLLMFAFEKRPATEGPEPTSYFGAVPVLCLLRRLQLDPKRAADPRSYSL